MATMTPAQFDELKTKKIEQLKEFFKLEPPKFQGDQVIEHWEKIYDDEVKNVVLETTSGPSNDATNYVYPYEKLRAIVGDGGNWKWPRMWQKFDEVERRGPAYREGEVFNFQGENKNPNILKQRCLVVGGGPIGLRMAIELKMGGHDVTVMEKRREIKDEKGEMQSLGFTNRINRPHMWHYVRNDLGRFNGKDFMSREAAYPVFTEPETSSVGIDELQVLLLKSVLLLGVDMRLGAGYDDAKIRIDPKTCKPTWDVECTYDKKAAEYFGVKEGKNTQNFDVLIGCDGSRSRVRETQQKFFGNIEKRKFMDCVGIVGNVQKLKKKRLQELGFPHGQEPSDMNRTKMVFKEFFEKLENEADADLENVIYYKASFHNYIILTPKRSNLIKHGLSGKVYHFAAGRSGAGNAMAEEKEKMKTYVKNVLKVAGIPIDETLSNGGFVEAPNDCMAFDFAECWNTPKSINFELAPPDYNVDEHGPWVGNSLAPMVALAGDALLEPFWPLGLGLKRGWQAIMDTAYAVDNLYNRTMYCAELKKDPNTFSWDMHWAALGDRIKENFQSCSKVEVADDLGKGEYASDGLVMLQWKKNAGEQEKPEFLVEVDPDTRYKKRNQTLNSLHKRLYLEDTKWQHPIVSKFMAIREYNETIKKEPEKNGWKNLVSINGKTVVKPKSGYAFKAPVDTAAPKPFKLPTAEIESKSTAKRESLMRQVTASQIDQHVTAASSKRSSQMASAAAGLEAALKAKQGASGQSMHELHRLGHEAPEADGLAEQSEAMWNRMLEKGLSPAQNAELAHIRTMINALQTSIAGYRKAEQELLMGAKK